MATPALGSLDESADEIRITVESTLPGDQPSGCEDSLVVDLDQPVGERSVVDATTGASLVSGNP